MRPSCFLAVLLVSALLILSFCHGSGRKMMAETLGHHDTVSESLEEKAREMIQLDYVDAGPNYNAKGGYLFTPPPPAAAAAPPPPPPSSNHD